MGGGGGGGGGGGALGGASINFGQVRATWGVTP